MESNVTPWNELMRGLDVEVIPSRQIPTEARVKEFERHIGVEVPPDYRTFLIEFGGAWVNAVVPIAEPTPCGEKAVIECFYGFMPKGRNSDDLHWQCDLAEGAPIAIPIARGAFASQVFLFTSDQKRLGAERGSVYFWDGENRSAWPDELFHQSFENLAPEIGRYLELRRNGLLLLKPPGLADFYRIAPTFTSFLEACIPLDANENM